jgi:hypothetical protein
MQNEEEEKNEKANVRNVEEEKGLRTQIFESPALINKGPKMPQRLVHH